MLSVNKLVEEEIPGNKDSTEASFLILTWCCANRTSLINLHFSQISVAVIIN